MSSVIYRKKDIPYIKNRGILFDTNILMYVYFASSSMGRWPTIYGIIYKKLLMSTNLLLVDYNILSEVVNRELRTCHASFEIYNKTKIEYKKWRNSPNGKYAEKRTYSIIKSILTNFTVDGKRYGLEDINNMLIPSNQDFTDKAIINLCKEKKYILFTNDHDFSGEDLEILSENYMI